MQVSRDHWGRTDAWKEKQHTDPEELEHLLALALLEHEERRTRR